MSNMKGMSLCLHSCCHHVSHGERKIGLSFCQQDGSQDWTATPGAVTGTLVNVLHGGSQAVPLARGVSPQALEGMSATEPPCCVVCDSRCCFINKSRATGSLWGQIYPARSW